jgi:peptidoglycan/xylan/chitin deacetylase (PgdA/CDA1 family)
MIVRARRRWGLAGVVGAVLLAGGQSGCGDSSSNPPAGSTDLVANIQVDAETDDVAGLNKLVHELEGRGITTTIYVTADYVNSGHALLVQDLYRRGFEIALHGYYSGEQLATMTHAEQLDLLTRAKEAVQGCRPCGSYKPVTGFRPQYFSQNEATYRVLESLGIEYNCGFKAGLLAVPGHEGEYAPYQASGDGFSFTAVPFTTVAWNHQTVYLCDLSAGSSELMTGPQWSQALQDGIDDALAHQRPFVALFHGYYSGADDRADYFEAFVAMLDRLEAEKATFMGTSELVAATLQ